MLNTDDVDNLAQLFGALGSDTRIRILLQLRDHPLCVGALATRLELTQSAVSQHLTVLRNAGLVESDKRGSFVHYKIRGDALSQCRRALEAILTDPQ